MINNENQIINLSEVKNPDFDFCQVGLNRTIAIKINDNYIKETVNKIQKDNIDQDFFSAIKICKKKRIGPARAEDNRPLFYKKDISLLARNGFDFETSKKVMELLKDDYLKIIKLI